MNFIINLFKYDETYKFNDFKLFVICIFISFSLILGLQ